VALVCCRIPLAQHHNGWLEDTIIFEDYTYALDMVYNLKFVFAEVYDESAEFGAADDVCLIIPVRHEDFKNEDKYSKGEWGGHVNRWSPADSAVAAVAQLNVAACMPCADRRVICCLFVTLCSAALP
jgi:hypothetical protein